MGQDPNRVFAGFSTVQDGMNGGIASSLILDSQFVFGRDVTIRDGYVRTRDPFANQVLTFASTVVQNRFTGIFQGACAYNSQNWNGFIVSVGGKLFTIQVDNNFLASEITPQLNIVTTYQFTVPTSGQSVLIPINQETPFTVGESILIDGGSYTIVQVLANQLYATYGAGAAHGIVIAGTPVLDSGNVPVIYYQTNPATYDFVYLFQAEQYGIILGGQNSTLIFNGATTTRAGVNQLPSGVFGIYLWGRIWIVLPNRTNFVAGDLVYEDGTTASILGMTENKLLNGGGAFSVPSNAGKISALNALANLDSSLGVGNLLVGTSGLVCSVNTPVDRTTWQNLTYPIQTISLLDYGPASSRGCANVNGDLWYRSTDGIRSFIVARREINSTGNTPQSREVSPVLNSDDPSLLEYTSAILFDNRLLTTVNPQRTDYGIASRGMVSINYDLLSTMQNKLPPAWEGVWTGLNIFQLDKVQIGGMERAFAFVNNNGVIELWELLKSGYYDQYTVNNQITRTRIQPVIETKSYDFGDGSQLKGLYTTEIFLDGIVDNVSITVKFRPDQYPNWTDWATVKLCAEVSQCSPPQPTPFMCSVFKQGASQYAARIMLPTPPETANTISNRPMSAGYQFQFRIEITGHCRIRRFKAHAKIQDDRSEGDCPPDVTCATVTTCELPIYNYDSHQGN